MIVKFIAKQKGSFTVPCPEISPRHTIGFNRGRAKTSNKIEIKKLLSNQTAARYVSLAPGQDMRQISEYLESDEQPDVMTKAFLDRVPFEAWKEIMGFRSDITAAFPLVGIAKATLEGKDMDDRIESIVNAAGEEKGDIVKNTPDSKPDPKKKAENPKVKTDPDPGKEKGSKKTKDVETETETTDPDPSEKKKGVKLKSVETDDDIELPLFTGPKGSTSKGYNVKEVYNIINDHEAEELREFISKDEDRKTVKKYWNDEFPDHKIE